MSRETLRQIRVGEADIRPLTRRGIEDALEWQPGSVAAIFAGGEPTRTPDDLTVTRDDDAELDELIEEAKVRRDRGDPTLYDTLMAVKRMNEVARQVRAADAQVDKGSQRAG